MTWSGTGTGRRTTSDASASASSSAAAAAASGELQRRCSARCILRVVQTPHCEMRDNLPADVRCAGARAAWLPASCVEVPAGLRRDLLQAGGHTGCARLPVGAPLFIAHQLAACAHALQRFQSTRLVYHTSIPPEEQ